MAKFIVDGSNDMSTVDLSTVANGDVTTNTSSEVVIKATDGSIYTLTGDFSGGEGSTLPTSGTITSMVVVSGTGDAQSRYAINHIALDVTTFEHDVTNNNATALFDTIFAKNDSFNLKSGVENTVSGGTGNDQFQLGDTLSANDSINGNGGTNTVILDGDYAGLTLSDTTLTNIDRLDLTGDNTYDITTADGTVAANNTLVVDARGQTGTVSFDGSAETDGKFDFLLGSQAGSTVTGGEGNDTFHGGGVGATLNGGGGNDNFIFGANFDGTDNIDGGAGTNVVHLMGDYSAGLTFGATSLENIEQLDVHRGDSYDLTLNAGNDTAGNSLDVHGETLSSSESLTFDGSAVAGNLTLHGGSGADTLIGGSGHNQFIGGTGADTMTAGSSIDNFIYNAVSDSTNARYDTISGFDTHQDHFVLPTEVTGIDSPVATGSLSTATFNGDLTRDIGSTELGAHHVVEFTASSGSLAGDTFLIIDANGVAGYQGGQDYVIQITNAVHIADLNMSDFTVS
ncbi:MAG TPA: calcium-binding protein [Rhizomicrobium sp.]|jgi:Ca2+-binding RTX toxin-like protein|nr:calcium-binding protein [Rhizomicrobium sp.]